MNYYLYTLFIVASGCTTSKPSTHTTAVAETAIRAIKEQYAPDSRTALFAVAVNGHILKGETNKPEAKATLLQRLAANNINFIDSINILPDVSLQQQHYAAVTVSVANLRSLPRHPAEQATQALMGTSMKVWKKERGWYLVQTPDHYLAWVDGGAITLMDSSCHQQWTQQAQLFFTQQYGFAYTDPSKTATVSDLVYGSLLSVSGDQDGFYKVQFPDNRTGYISKDDAMPYTEWAASRQPTGTNMVATARRLMGLPYLWGGTSTKGVDCSGFTKTVYLMNGLVLPRDASQQVQIGIEVDTKEGWANMLPGDLLFFGAPAKDGRPERVVHVGIWIGDNAEFIHSASMVRINSLNPQAPNYDESEHKRFLRAKRITPQTALTDLRQGKAF